MIMWLMIGSAIKVIAKGGIGRKVVLVPKPSKIAKSKFKSFNIYKLKTSIDIFNVKARLKSARFKTFNIKNFSKQGVLTKIVTNAYNKEKSKRNDMKIERGFIPWGDPWFTSSSWIQSVNFEANTFIIEQILIDMGIKNMPDELLEIIEKNVDIPGKMILTFRDTPLEGHGRVPNNYRNNKNEIKYCLYRFDFKQWQSKQSGSVGSWYLSRYCSKKNQYGGLVTSNFYNRFVTTSELQRKRAVRNRIQAQIKKSLKEYKAQGDKGNEKQISKETTIN